MGKSFLAAIAALALTAIAVPAMAQRIETAAVQSSHELVGAWGVAHMDLPGVGPQDLTMQILSVNPAGVTGTFIIQNQFGDRRKTEIPLSLENTMFDSGVLVIGKTPSKSRYRLRLTGTSLVGQFHFIGDGRDYPIILPHSG